MDVASRKLDNAPEPCSGVWVQMTKNPVTIIMPGTLSLSDRQPPAGPGHHAAAAPGKTTMMSGSGSVVLPAGMINPAVPIRDIKMKFAVLVGLIQAGSVSNRDIVETVLNLVSAPFFKKYLFIYLYFYLHLLIHTYPTAQNLLLE